MEVAAAVGLPDRDDVEDVVDDVVGDEVGDDDEDEDVDVDVDELCVDVRVGNAVI